MRIFVGGDGRLRAGWRLIVQYAAYTVLTALIATVVVVSLSFGGGAVSPTGPPGPLAGLYVVSLGAAVLTVWLAGRYLDRRPLEDFGLRFGPAWWADFAFGLGLGAALMAAIFGLQVALGWVSVTEVLAGSGGGFLLGLAGPLVIFVCVGISEELISRGYQLRNGAEGLAGLGMGPRGAVLLAWALSSAFFGLLHAANPNATLFSTTNIVLAGLMLGAGYVLTGELAIPIGLHISWNLFQGNVFGFPVSGTDIGGSSFVVVEQGGPPLWTGGPFGPEGGLIGLLAIAAGGGLILLYVRLRRGGARIETAVASPPPRAVPAGPEAGSADA